MNDPISDEGGGPEVTPPDEPSNVNNGRRSIEERAAAGEGGDEEQLPGIAPLAGDKQLTLAGLGPRSMPIEAEVSLMSASVPSKGLIDPEKRGQLLVAFLPNGYNYVPVREGGEVKRWKLRMQLRPVHIISGDNPFQPFIEALLEEGADIEVVERAARKIGPMAEEAAKEVKDQLSLADA